MADAKEAKAKPDADTSVVVVDIGKKYRRKHIRRLRKGRGKLMDKVEQLVSDLREHDSFGDNVKPVVIVVREKRRRSRLF